MSKFSAGVSGLHVLVTGGSKGIGRGIVESFLAEGAIVSYCSRSVRGDEFASFKNAAPGARAIGSRLDITNPAEIDDWVQASAKEVGKINIVVANAVTGAGLATLDDWKHSFQGEVLGLIALIESVTPHLAKQSGNASIIVIASLAGVERRHPVIAGPYGTLKRAQISLAKDYSRKLTPMGIRINAIAPGFVETPDITHPDGTVEISTYHQQMSGFEKEFEAMLSTLPMKRPGVPQEIANTTIFLGSNLSSYVSGECIVVDGGLSIGF